MKKSTGKLKIAIIAPPWLSLYPGCYYGIENVVHHLAAKLTEQGHHVELFSVKGTKTNVTKLHWYHEADQYKHIHRPYHEANSVLISHLLYSLNKIREDGTFDIIHDHNSFIGPAVLAYITNLPPILHTLHEPFTDPRRLASGVPDNRLMFDQFKSIKNLYFNTVSHSQKSYAPAGLMPRIKGVVHNAVDPDEYEYTDDKSDYFTIVASVKPDKGQHIAAKACYELGYQLKIAGTVGAQLETPKQLQAALTDQKIPLADDPYISYFRNQITPYLIPGQIEYLGKVFGAEQKQLYAKAKAYLFPVEWEEPFGMSALDALASGTPVVAYNRGALPEIIQHGVNGFLAKNYREFKQYMKRVDEIDPAECRRSVEEKFSTEVLVNNYVNLYQKIVRQHVRVLPSLNKFTKKQLDKLRQTMLLTLEPQPKLKRKLPVLADVPAKPTISTMNVNTRS